MLELSIRDARDSDLGQVAEIKVRNWADTYASLVEPNLLRPYLDRKRQLDDLRTSVNQPGTLLLVACDESGTVIGFSLTYLDRTPEPWLESLHVLREFRSSGVGSLLMRATATRLRASGHNGLRLGVVSGNAGAARFYERLGGILIGREPAAWAEGVWHELYRWPDLAPLTSDGPDAS
jgi:ribosomal protein S18 acetylase RimI-like enzyme